MEAFITKLEANQVLVFGSNLNGWHGGGAARQAKEKFGAVEGQAHGIQGQSYAIATLNKNMEKIRLSTIRRYLRDLAFYAKKHPKNEFLLTPIGTGIAGYSLQEIRSILPEFPANVTFAGKWEN